MEICYVPVLILTSSGMLLCCYAGLCIGRKSLIWDYRGYQHPARQNSIKNIKYESIQISIFRVRCIKLKTSTLFPLPGRQNKKGVQMTRGETVGIRWSIMER